MGSKIWVMVLSEICGTLVEKSVFNDDENSYGGVSQKVCEAKNIGIGIIIITINDQLMKIRDFMLPMIWV